MKYQRLLTYTVTVVIVKVFLRVMFGNNYSRILIKEAVISDDGFDHRNWR